MAAAILSDLFGDAFRLLAQDSDYQGLTAAARGELHLKDDDTRYVKRKLRELDITTNWNRHASKAKATKFFREVEKVVAANRAAPRVARKVGDKTTIEKENTTTSDTTDDEKDNEPELQEVSDNVIQYTEFNLGTSDTIDNIEAGKASDSDNSESSTVQQFYIGEGSDVGSQTVLSLPSEVHEVVMCATPEQVVTTAFNQLARDAGASFRSLALAISEVNSYEEYMRSVLLPIIDVHAGTSDDARAEGSIRDNEHAIAVQDCWKIRVLVHKLDDAIYDEVENATTIDHDPAVVCELWSALAPRYKARYYVGGSFLSWDIAAYLDAPWGGVVWGREVPHASDAYNITAMLDRLHIMTR